jgi:hypothetical protein
MKLRLSILLLAAALAAAPAAGQTIKSLGFNTTNGQVVYSGTNPLTFTNSLLVASQTGSVLSVGTTNVQIRRDPGSGSLIFTANGNTNTFEFLSSGTLRLSGPLSFDATTNALGYAATTRTNLGGTTVGNALFTAATTSAARVALGGTIVGENIFTVPIQYQELYLRINADNTVSSLSPAATRTNLGLGATNNVTFSNITASGTLAVSNTATFSTNVTVNGNISVGSLTTTTPSTWALDATQTAAATNGILALPSNANVLRITNGNTISGVSNGVLGAFYFLINQSGTNVVISNSATITTRGATNITLGTNQSATLIATTATNATAH